MSQTVGQFKLTRDVRFSVPPAGFTTSKPVTNSFAGYPTIEGIWPFLTLRITLVDALDLQSQYVKNIRDIDQQVRSLLIGQIDPTQPPTTILISAFDTLKDAWKPAELIQLELLLSPYTTFSYRATEKPMVRLSQKFEFSASHRLHNPSLSEADNRATFGKCNNPRGHGHNYELQVTLIGEPNTSGVLVNIPDFEQIVQDTVIEKLDHKHLNDEVPEFRTLIPSVENIAKTIFQMLKPQLVNLKSITVWETSKTSCEYSE